MVEKRRRTRINLALLELKELTLEYFHKDVSGSTEKILSSLCRTYEHLLSKGISFLHQIHQISPSPLNM